MYLPRGWTLILQYMVVFNLDKWREPPPGWPALAMGASWLVPDWNLHFSCLALSCSKRQVAFPNSINHQQVPGWCPGMALISYPAAPYFYQLLPIRPGAFLQGHCPVPAVNEVGGLVLIISRFFVLLEETKWGNMKIKIFPSNWYRVSSDLPYILNKNIFTLWTLNIISSVMGEEGDHNFQQGNIPSTQAQELFPTISILIRFGNHQQDFMIQAFSLAGLEDLWGLFLNSELHSELSIKFCAVFEIKIILNSGWRGGGLWGRGKRRALEPRRLEAVKSGRQSPPREFPRIQIFCSTEEKGCCVKDGYWCANNCFQIPSWNLILIGKRKTL